MRNSASFARCHRIVDSATYKAVGRNRNTVYGRYFNIRSAPNALNCARLGLIVSKRVSKKAVQRNRIKRQIREVFRHLQGKLSTMDFVVIAKPSGAKEANPVLREELVRLLHISQKKCQNQS